MTKIHKTNTTSNTNASEKLSLIEIIIPLNIDFLKYSHRQTVNSLKELISNLLPSNSRNHISGQY
jgi:hypothetical protein